MGIYMLTMWYPFHKAAEVARIASRITTLPPYITKWQRLGAADGQNDAKVYNIIYMDDNHIAEAELYIAKLASLFYDIEGFTWKVEPVMSMRDAVKVQSVKI